MSKIDVLPISNNVVMEEVNPGELKIGGIYLPDDMKSFVKRARVVAVGPGRPLSGVFVPSMCRAGDIVFYAVEQFSTIKFADASYLIGNEEGIFAIIEPSDLRRTEITDSGARATDMPIHKMALILDTEDKPFVVAPPSSASRKPREE